MTHDRSGAALQPLRVLLVEDCADDAALLVGELRRRGYVPESQRVETEPAFRAALGQTWDCILADYDLPHFSGLAALRIFQESGLDLPFIVVSGAIGEETAIATMKAGAHDYIMKDNLARLGPALERELRETQIRRERRRVAEALEADRIVANALGRVGREMIAALNTAAFLDRLCQIIAEVLACDYSDTALYEPQERVYSVVATHGHSPEMAAIIRALKVPVDSMANVRNRPVHAAETLSILTARMPASPAAQLMQRLGITLSLFIPLRCGSELIGFQAAGYCGREDPFTATQQRIADGAGQLASMALEHARTVEALTRANRLKSDFVATMSHELRTPMNIIMGYTDLLLDEVFGSLNAEQVSAVRTMDKSARQLLELINATLDLSRLEAGHLPMNLSDVSMATVIGDVREELRPLHEKPGTSVSWEVEPAIPSLRTDAAKLKIIIKNLVENAVKFTETGTVSVAVSARGGGVEVRVRDPGIGIPRDALSIIFEPFRQLEHSATRTHGGVGLGLFLVRRLLDLLGGTITVDSDVGKGSTFNVWLPCDHQGQAADPAGPAS